MARHGTQLVGHFLIGESGTIALEHIEALDRPNRLCHFPDATQIIAAACALRH